MLSRDKPTQLVLPAGFSDDLDRFIDHQLVEWPELRESYSRLYESKFRNVKVGVDGIDVEIRHLPLRIKSSGADISKVDKRPCFLCRSNLLPQQRALPFGDFDILLNPYPIVQRHLTIVHREHRKQELDQETIRAFAQLAFAMPRRVLFYNGANCGASAPDHLHFQSIPNLFSGKRFYASNLASGELSTIDGVVSFISDTIATLSRIADNGKKEPDFNLAALATNRGTVEVVIFPRKKLRPSIYSASSDSEGFMVSPATIEMLGVMITPLLKDYERLTPRLIEEIYKEVCFYL